MEKYEFTVDNKVLIELDPDKKYILSIPVALEDCLPECLVKLTGNILGTLGNNVVIIPVPYQTTTIPAPQVKEDN